ncbi:MAG: type II toxin-antitoxin system HipA family toxin [Luteolibacter sp.]
MAKTLDVYLKQECVGHLEQDDAGLLWFNYSEVWLKSDFPVALSHSLPLRGERFSRNECRAFFSGLLPEETSRELIAKSFGVSDQNDFAILEKIGGECAGAVSLMPSGIAPIAATGDYREISSDELAEKIGELPLRPLLAGEEGIRLSLAGAQGKIAIAIFNGKFFLPLNGSPSTHILKPQGLHFEGLVENEFFCMSLAALAGLEAADVEIRQAGTSRFLQVLRYDRVMAENGSADRIHQEDFCQALGIAPELKYQAEGGPNLKRCFELVREVCSRPGPDVLRLFDAVVFNYLIGNNDAHGKNFSFLYEDGAARLAPLYDLVCTQAYPELAKNFAMKIGDERQPDRVAAKNWLKFFGEAGVGPAIAKKRLLSLAQRVGGIVREMDQSYPGWKSVSPIVLRNCARVGALG